MKNTQFDFSDFETKIRSGRGAEVREFILQIKIHKLSRYEKIKFANLARRVGLPEISILLLRSQIRPVDGSRSDATSEEKCEYGAALIKEGLVGEGLKILKDADSDESHEALLYTAFGLFTRWDYRSAEPHLRRYLEKNLTPYQNMVGRTNFAATLVFLNKTEEAFRVLQTLAEDARKTSSKLVLSYAYELMGQCALSEKNYGESRFFFQRAGEESQDSSTSTPFMVRKWLAILDLLENKNSGEKSIVEVTREAARIKDYETLRTCDLHRAVAARDVSLAQRVYFGTPHLRLREKIELMVSPFTQLPNCYVQSVNLQSAEIGRTFDMLRGCEIEGSAALKTGKNLHRLLRVIAADFYRPIRATEIFSLIFPDEYFDPDVSINRVHQAIKRLRQWTRENAVPLEIAETKNSYHLITDAKYAILWSAKNRISKEDFQLIELQKNYFDREFSAKEAGEVLKLSDRSASRLIKQALENDKLFRLGSGPATKYKLKLPKAG